MLASLNKLLLYVLLHLYNVATIIPLSFSKKHLVQTQREAMTSKKAVERAPRTEMKIHLLDISLHYLTTYCNYNYSFAHRDSLPFWFCWCYLIPCMSGKNGLVCALFSNSEHAQLWRKVGWHNIHSGRAHYTRQPTRKKIVSRR